MVRLENNCRVCYKLNESSNDALKIMYATWYKRMTYSEYANVMEDNLIEPMKGIELLFEAGIIGRFHITARKK